MVAPTPGSLGAIVLAAGRGVRIASRLPKVLHPVGGVPMVLRVVRAAQAAGIADIVLCVGPEADEIRAALPEDVRFVVQPEPRGTGDAVRVSLAVLPSACQTVLVIGADTPLTTPETLRSVALGCADAPLALAVSELDHPRGYGRVVRNAQGSVQRIVEDADATPEERALSVVFGWPMAFQRSWLEGAIQGLQPASSGELYLTQLIGDAVQAGKTVQAIEIADQWDIVGVNSRRDLAAVEGALHIRVINRLLDGGVTIIDPASTYVDESVEVDPDVVIHPQTFLRGQTVVGAGCVIGPSTEIIDSRLEPEVRVWWSVVEGARVASGVRIGPFCRIRPDTVIHENVSLGSFVEVKNSEIGDHTQVNHLSYVGDADLGARVNVGAGSVTANYDGRDKHRTVIGDGAFIGSGSMVIAPRHIGEGALTGAGSVVTHDVRPGERVAGVPARPLKKKSTDHVQEAPSPQPSPAAMGEGAQQSDRGVKETGQA